MSTGFDDLRAFLQVTPLHLVTNMFGLLVVGPLVESRLGRARFLAVYLLSAVAASTCFCWLAVPEWGLYGASGAVCGLAMAQIVVSLSSRNYVTFTLAIIITATALYFDRDGHTSWQSHLGGGLGGLTASAILLGPRTRHRLRLACFAAVLVTALAIRAIMLR